MIRSLSFLLLLLCVQGFAGRKPAKPAPSKPLPQVEWLAYGKALEQAHRDSMFMLVDVYAKWCVPCKEMDATTYHDSAVVSVMNRNFLPVRLDAESDSLIQCNNWPRKVSECVTENWKLNGVPALVLIGPSGNYILSISQGIEPEPMRGLLHDFLDQRKSLLENDREPLDSADEP